MSYIVRVQLCPHNPDVRTGTLYIRSKQARRNRTCTCTYVRHRKQVSIYLLCKVRLFICALCTIASYSASLLFRIVPSHSCLIHSGDCAWCRQGEHGPLGRVLITLNLPLGLAATERRIPTRPPILPACTKATPCLRDSSGSTRKSASAAQNKTCRNS